MTDVYISSRCPVCGKALGKRSNEDIEKTYYCAECEKSFDNSKVHRMAVVFSTPTAEDNEEFSDCGMNVDLRQRVKVTVTDDFGHQGYSYLTLDNVTRLGKPYIKDHIWLSGALDTYFVNLSENSYHNDPARNPERMIPVSFVEIEPQTGREVYKGLESGRYYLRESSSREHFAKWLVCGKHRMPEDGSEPRPNLIFQCGDQTEKVTYHDWNGVCAYSDTFNSSFYPEGKEKKNEK